MTMLDRGRLSRSDALELVAPPQEGQAAGPLRDRQEQLRTRLLEIDEAFANGAITLAQMTAATASLRAQLDQV